MSLYLKLQHRMPEFNIELITQDNLNSYENIFYCNQEYYLITDGRAATKQDCIETIEYGNGFPENICYCIGFSLNGEAVAILSILEGYPETDTLYIGLFLMNENFKRKSIGTKIISTLIDESFSTQYSSIKLSVQDNNICGYSFWSKLGFKVTKKCKCDNFYNLSMELK
ncbi:MAG: GNAT family N-acetyltransferase [Clostridiales bacterium]|nr:GNAT family N-acetyltransferase [Clostridiales bacterium]